MNAAATVTSLPRQADAVATRQDGVDELLASLVARLAELRGLAEQDRFVNPVQLMALELAAELRRSELETRTVESVVARLTARAFRHRAGRLAAYLGELDPGRNRATLERLFRGCAVDDAGAPLPFAAFAARIERLVYGFVLTAHPTFAFSAELQRELAALATGRDAAGQPLDETGLKALLERVEAAAHRPEPVLDLASEHIRSIEAVGNLQAAIETAHEVLFEVAAELYPTDWQRLRPRLVSVASWVGYDMDGRSDISWRASFAMRLGVQIAQLGAYARKVRELHAALAKGSRLGPLLELVEAKLELALQAARAEQEVFAANGAPSVEALAKTARAMAASRAVRLKDARELEALVGRCIEAADEPSALRSLCVLRAAIAGHGLAAAGTHVRINATQLHNSIRKQIGMDHPADDPTYRLTYLEAVERLIERVEPVAINFGSLEQEKASARRVFMVVAQMLKYLDASEPVRFLIAECETPLTLLAALYFAKLFGVDQRLDISPLFETRKALERGATVLDGALAVPAYRDYVRGRGRLCLQTGYSDAGRYLGQTAASVAIERIRLDLVEVLERHGLADVEVVIFDTHGESIGRGAHPSSFGDRLLYVDTPESRRRFAAAGVWVVQETSYQGGDGYQLFITEPAALAVLTRVLEHCLAPRERADPDPFYADRVYADEFFAAVRAFNARVIDDPAYATLLGVYGTNLLYQTGSRAVRRQHEGAMQRPTLDHPSQVRAIPHNAILQQLGVLANTIGGLGQAVAKDPERFQTLYRESDRFRRLMSMVEHAFMFTDLTVMKAYLDRFDPGFWLLLAEEARDLDEREELLDIAHHVERLGMHEALARILRVLWRDHMDLAHALRDHRRRTRSAGERPIAVGSATRDELHILHALRLALIERITRRAVRLPDFSDRHAITHDDLVAALIQLEVEPALRTLATIFPILEAQAPQLDWGEASTYAGDAEQSYWQEHERLFRPTARDYELVRRIGSAIIHHIGAVG